MKFPFRRSRSKESAAPLGRQFGYVFAGQTVSHIGDRITIFVIPTLMIFALDASAFEVGLVTMAQYLGIPFVDPIAGVLVDRWDKRRTMIACDLIRVVAVAAIPAAYLSRAAMAHLRAGGGRLVTIGSVHGLIAPPFNEAYSAAKFAVEGFMESLAPVAAEAGVSVTLVVPGPVRGTNFGIFPDVNRQTVLAASGPYAPTMRTFIEWQNEHFWADAQSAEEVANAVLGALTMERPPVLILTSDWAAKYVAAKLADPDGAAIQARTRSWVSGA